MASSADRTITFILLVLGAVICLQAQTTTQKSANASISGQVTIKGKPAVGVVIIAMDARDKFSSTMSGHRARTDQTGSYRFTNLSAGTYAISPITPALVPAHDSDSVVVADGEEVQDVDILLVPGGVITGKNHRFRRRASHWIASSVDFYVNVLGFELEGEEGPFTVVRVSNDFTLQLAPWGTSGNEHLAFALSREAFDKVFARVKARGIPYGDSYHAVGNNLGPGVESGARGPAPTLYINDPNKHLIEIRTYD